MGELRRFSTEEILGEAEYRKAVLRADKKVDTWPEKLGPDDRGGPIDVSLTVKDCLHLGGKVEIDYSCSTTGVSCTTHVIDDEGKGHTYVACINENTI
jgi:hypothetical protein